MPPIPELEALRRTQILDAARRAMAAQGVANVTMDDICRAAGLSKGGLAHYYKSKRELFRDVFTAFFEGIFRRSREAVAALEDPREQLLAFGWLYDPDDPDAAVGYPLLFDFMSMAVRDPEYRRILEDWFDRWVALLQGAIEKGQARGHFPGIDAPKAARAISAVYQGVATRWFLAPADHPREWALAAVAAAIAGVLSAGAA